MPTQKFKSIDEVYKALTDFEIEDDSTSDGVPMAIINVKGIHRIKVGMVSEWDFYKHLNPMKDRMLAYYAQSIIAATTNDGLVRISEKTKQLVTEFTGVEPQDIKEITNKIAYFFEDEPVRYQFFKGLKEMGIIHWWVSWRRWQKKVTRHHTLTLFIMLWAFNYDGFKKKTTALLESVSTMCAIIRSQSPIESSNYTDFGTYQKMYLKARKKLVEQSVNNSRN